MKRFILSIALLITIIGGGKLIMHLTYPESAVKQASPDNNPINEIKPDSITTDSIQ